MSEHTPGPWRYWIYGAGTRIEVLTSESEFHKATPIALTYRDASELGFKFTPPNAEANARLIAAAPELLDALKHAVQFNSQEWANKAEAAIAKAEGKGE